MRSPCGSDAIWGMFLYFIVLVLTVTTVIRISKITTSFDLRRSKERTDVFAHWLFVVCLPEQQILSCLFYIIL